MENEKSSGLIGLFDQVIIWISLIFGGAALAFMTGFSVWNVLIMRKALNAPITGAEDLLILVLVAIVALCIPLGARTGAHIEIEILETRMSPGFAKYSKIAMKLLGIFILCIMAWRLWHAGGTAAKFGETTQQLLISYAPFYYFLALSIGLYVVVLILDIWQLLQGREAPRLKVGGDGL